MMRWFGGLIICVTLLYGCSTTDYEGYSRLDQSVHFKLVSLGDGEKCIEENNYVSMNVAVSAFDSTPLAKKNVSRLKFSNGTWSKPIKRVLQKACEGDSISFIGTSGELNLDDWFSPLSFQPDSQLLRVTVAVTEVLTDKKLLQKRAEERLQHDLEMSGHQAMKRSLDSLRFNSDEMWQGIYFRSIKDGNGERIQSGKLAFVNYRAYLPDGTIIDDTYKASPFEYHVGKPDQAIEGFTLAMSRMRVGGKAVFLIPYSLAFGAGGSSSGIVPPYSAVIYEAELIEIR